MTAHETHDMRPAGTGDDGTRRYVCATCGIDDRTHCDLFRGACCFCLALFVGSVRLVFVSSE